MIVRSHRQFPSRNDLPAAGTDSLRRFILLCAISCFVATGQSLRADDEADYGDAPEKPTRNRADEPLAESFSLSRAGEFLDAASYDWQNARKCVTCHTNGLYLMSRSRLSEDLEIHDRVRAFADGVVTDGWAEADASDKKGPPDAEVVLLAAGLSLDDAATTGELADTTRAALDRMWTVQREDGGWEWIKCGWAPLESDDHFGVTLAALAVGSAANDYAATPQAVAGVKKLREYLASNPGDNLHQRGMALWASTRLDGLLSDAARAQCVADLSALQQEDGGWSLASLGDWDRDDGTPQDTETSNGYGTGFVTFLLLKAGVPAGDPRVERGITWLKTNQRESGRWYTRSLFRDSKHFITHAGTAFAVMALTSHEAAGESVAAR